MSNNSNKWIDEFKEFVEVKEIEPPRNVTNAIFSRVRSDLNPSLKLIAAKLFGLHLAAGAIVLFFCPQLGVGALMGGHGIMHFFMYSGPVVCAGLCGAIFLGTSALFSTVFLTREELLVANRYRFLNVSFLAALSFVVIILSGGEADRLSYLSWIFGALTAGWIVLKMGAVIRFRQSMIAW